MKKIKGELVQVWVFRAKPVIDSDRKCRFAAVKSSSRAKEYLLWFESIAILSGISCRLLSEISEET
ncbi:MAG TPA: hypothetical protein VER35_01180 [Candidatus Limnocylindrales bacterium]|nr:hypothetical protein [Candidatus Limnocylindrales bacterium]